MSSERGSGVAVNRGYFQNTAVDIEAHILAIEGKVGDEARVMFLKNLILLIEDLQRVRGDIERRLGRMGRKEYMRLVAPKRTDTVDVGQ